MRVSLNSLLHVCLLGLAALHLFSMEDTYGLDVAPALWYRAIGGLTAVDAVLLILALVSALSARQFKCAFGSKLVLGLLSVALATAYGRAWFQGNLFGSELGSGLKEARAATVMLCLYYVFRKLFGTTSGLRRFHAHFQALILASAGFCLARYVLGIDPLSTVAHDRLTTFEGPLLVFWAFGFAVYSARAMQQPAALNRWAAPVVMALAVFLSYRRSPAYMVAVAFIAQCVFSLWSPRRALYTAVVVALVVGALIYSGDNWLTAKLNPAALFDTYSEEYAQNRASNVQHANDIRLGWEMVKRNPVWGVGPGARLESPDPLIDLAVETGIHMQYFHFWLRLGFPGLLLLLVYYGVILGYGALALRAGIGSPGRELALGIAAFVVASASIASLTGLSIYGTNKLQFLSMYIFAGAESLYILHHQPVRQAGEDSR